MSDEPFNFDFNEVALPSRASAAAESVTRADLTALFGQLEAASALWNKPAHGQRGATIAALSAVTSFVASQGYDLAGEISRPLALLLEELRTAPAAAPGSILPPVTRGQAVEATKRQTVNRLKASAAYAARALVTPEYSVKRACNEIATVLIAHRFPATDYFKPDGSEKPAPAPSTIAARITEWVGVYKDAQNEPGKFFRSFAKQSPLGFIPDDADKNERALRWLRDELEAGGYLRR